MYLIFYSDSAAKVDQDNEQDDSGTVFFHPLFRLIIF